jgi:hypothetical protein
MPSVLFVEKQVIYQNNVQIIPKDYIQWVSKVIRICSTFISSIQLIKITAIPIFIFVLLFCAC